MPRALVLLVLGGCAGAADYRDTVDVDGASLAVSVRGQDATAPLLLVIHGGPGFAMIDLLHTHSPQFEDEFVVVSYDQRGAGLSEDPDLDPATMTLAQLVDDADVVRQSVLDALDRSDDADVYVMGHSMGTMVGLDLVAKYPDHYAAFIGAGQVVNVIENEQGSYDFALDEATANDETDALHELRCVGRPTDDFEYVLSASEAGVPCDGELDGFEVTNRWIGYFGGDLYGETSSDAVEEEVFSSYPDVDRWIAGLDFSQHLFDDPEVTAWDARERHLDDTVPLYFFQGRHDYDTPAPLVEAYTGDIVGPYELVWFEDSAHFPFYEQPEMFLDELVAVRDGG